MQLLSIGKTACTVLRFDLWAALPHGGRYASLAFGDIYFYWARDA
jgi:hypothetical protein